MADQSTLDKIKGKVIGEFKVDQKDGHLLVSGYRGQAPEKLEIPEKIKGIKVHGIAPRAFKADADIAEVVLHDSVQEIGYEAFQGCAELRTVHCGADLTKIGSEAFADCTALESIELPDGLQELMRGVFKGCTSLDHVELPNALTTLNRETFRDCSSLTSVCLPYGLQRIGRRAFLRCEKLADVFYFSKRGISDVMTTDRELVEHALPNDIEYIGEEAFRGCAALTRVALPYRVKTIPESCFRNDKSLVSVELHNSVQEIGDNAFIGCTGLARVRLPALCKKIGEKAFSKKTSIVAQKNSFAAKFAAENGLPFEDTQSVKLPESSRMIPVGSGQSEQTERFYTDEQVRSACDRYEVRKPSYDLVEREERDESPVTPSRYSYDGKVYHGSSAVEGQARIMMVGDLMARFRQQNLASQYQNDYSFSFDLVRDLIQQSDFAIGNMESMVAPSAPYTLEREHVNARPHLNAPPSLLSAIRGAGFDAVSNAQNHVYDAGTQGVYETLDNMNRHQLMHTGAFVSSTDERYLLVDIGGIRVGIVAYLDGARQRMKKANFTKRGRETMFPIFDEERIRADIQAVKEAGAEFVLSYCHWGREYTDSLTDRQKGFAQMVADAGADYIFGAHSHCIQPFDEITTSDGRQVPCLYSGGNFLSDINLKPPITRDTLIIDVVLERGEDGAVRIKSNEYHPCRILNMSRDDGRFYQVIPSDGEVGEITMEKLLEAEDRIVSVVGDKISMAEVRL